MLRLRNFAHDLIEKLIKRNSYCSMARLVDLPFELRDYIWKYVCQRNRSSLPYSIYNLLRTNRQFRTELAPYLYECVTVYLQYPSQILQWVEDIGTYNSSFIQTLIVKSSCVEPKSGVDGSDVLEKMWSGSLKLMARLGVLIYYYKPSENYQQSCSGFEDNRRHQAIAFKEKAELLEEHLERLLDEERCGPDLLETWAASPLRPITHAVLAIDEPMPEINQLSFKKLLSFDMGNTLGQNLTRLSPLFFTSRGFEMRRTYAVTEDPQQHSMALTYRKAHALELREPPDLQDVLTSLPHLRYLRLGCPKINSTFLSFLPSRIETADVSFYDDDPQRISWNLKCMRERCERLFTLAIAVSPLHDFVEMPDGGRRVDQQFTGEDLANEWKPFWDALKSIQGTGVSVWEGEGPRFKSVGDSGPESPKSFGMPY